MAMIICDNCGSSFDEGEPKCPYCGYINESGAEKKYMEDLNELRDNLDHVDEEQEDMYKEEAARKIRIIAIIAFVLAAIVVVITAVIIITRSHADKVIYGNLSVDAVANEEADYKKLDELYAAGKYDELNEQYNKMLLAGENSIYRWEHSAFVIYREKFEEYSVMVDVTLKDNDEYGYANLVSYIVEFYAREYATQITYPTLPKEDLEALDEMREELLADARTRFDLTDEDLEEYVKETISEYKIVKMDECLKIGKRWKEGKK